ncbi:hypothetical protein KY334_06485 [Candidatus Woesearchaeota archaeon]|nr:hypothetical protein [Candidatus Woesearchaeota archaeon]
MNFKKLFMVLFVFILSLSLVFALDFNFNSGISRINLNQGEFDSVRLIVSDLSKGPILLADLVSSSPTDSFITLGNSNVFLTIGTNELAYNYIGSYSKELIDVNKDFDDEAQVTNKKTVDVFNRINFDNILEISDDVYFGNPDLMGITVLQGDVLLKDNNALIANDGKIVLSTSGEEVVIGMSGYALMQDNVWTYFEGEITGETLETSNSNSWRAGTEKAKVLILANYGQGSEYELFFDDIKLVEAGSDENLIINGDAEDGSLPMAFGDEVVFTVSDVYNSGSYGYYTQGYQVLQSNMVDIDTSKTYTLSGWFKSGDNQPEFSNIYFGFVPYTEDEMPILSQNVIVVPGTETTLRRDIRKEDTEIRLQNLEDCENWVGNNLNEWVAFDIGDDYSDLPNFNISNKIHSVYVKNGICRINFTDGVGVDAPTGTRVREHLSGATYLYTAASKGGVSDEVYDINTGTITYDGAGKIFNFDGDVFVAGYKFSEIGKVVTQVLNTSYLINLNHTVQDCIDAGGIVVNAKNIKDKTYDDLVELAGETQLIWPNPLIEFDGTDFCWFNQPKCTDGWRPYKEWSITSNVFCDGDRNNLDLIDYCSPGSCNTGEHKTFENNRETCNYRKIQIYCHDGGCENWAMWCDDKTCQADVVQRGCY